VVRTSYDNLSEQARFQLKIRVLDSLGCAIGALEGEPINLLGQHIQDFGGEGYCTLLGGERTAPDRAAFFNCALVRTGQNASNSRMCKTSSKNHRPALQLNQCPFVPFNCLRQGPLIIET